MFRSDIIGNTQCDALGGQPDVPTAKGHFEFTLCSVFRGDLTGSFVVTAQGWCREMKVTQAFSWMLFVSFAIAFITLLALVFRAQAFGRYDIWEEPIRGESSSFLKVLSTVKF